MESEITLTNFCTRLHYILGLSCPLNRNFTHAQFCNTLYWSFWKHWFAALYQSSKCLTVAYHYTISKITFINITTHLPRKVFKYWKAVKFLMADTSFPNVSFSFKSLHLIIGNKNCEFSLKWQAYFIHFQKKYLAKYPSLSNQSQFFCQVKSMLYEKNQKTKNDLFSLKFKQQYKCFFLSQPRYFRTRQMC